MKTLFIGKVLVIAAICVSVCGPALARGSFYDGKGEGWLFHNWQAPVEEPVKEEPEKPEVESPTPVEEVEEKVAEDVSPKDVFLSAAWLRENMQVYMDRAIDNPTPENIAAYAYLQKVAVDKSHRFTEGMQEAVVMDPLLDENTRRPLAGAGGKAANRAAKAASKKALSELSKVAGIWFFYRSDCPYCEIEAPLLKSLQDRYGIKTYAISIDGRPMPGGFFPDFKKDNGQAEKLEVIQTPAMFVVRPGTRDIVPLGQTLLSGEELEDRLILVTRKMGLLPEETYEKTKPMRLDYRFEAPVVPEDSLDDPEAMIRQLRHQLEIDKGVR